MRLRKDGVKIEVVSVGVKYHDLSYVSHQKTLPTPTNITAELHRTAVELFHELWDHETPIRHLGLHTSRVKDGEEARQLSLFAIDGSPRHREGQPDFSQLEHADAMSDEVRERFGIDAIKRAAFLEQKKIDHVSGGIQRDKHKMDYEKIKID
jgi:DNA polymerase-4